MFRNREKANSLGHADGPYLIAPDSAEPIPAEAWEGIDVEAVEAFARDQHEAHDLLSPVERRQRVTSTGIVLSPNTIEIVKTIGVPIPGIPGLSAKELGK